MIDAYQVINADCKMRLPLVVSLLLGLCRTLFVFEPTNMKIAYRAKDIMEAEIIKGMLIANGIQAYSSGFYLQGAIGDLASTDFSKVHVHDDDYVRARKLVKEYESQLSDQDASQVRIDSSNLSPAQKLIISIAIAIAISIFIYWPGI